jgi:hypothetical protein
VDKKFNAAVSKVLRLHASSVQLEQHHGLKPWRRYPEGIVVDSMPDAFL